MPVLLSGSSHPIYTLEKLERALVAETKQKQQRCGFCMWLHLCSSFYSVGGLIGQHVPSSLTWKREKSFIVKVLVDSYSLYKHYDHSSGITRVYRIFLLWWCRAEWQTFCTVKGNKGYYLFIRLQRNLSHSLVTAPIQALDCWQQQGSL